MKSARLGKVFHWWRARYLAALLLLLALLLRASAWGSWGFGFDQVQIIREAQQIAEGDLTLIGPRTGPVGSLFTGPLIYYLTAAFYLLGAGYYSLILTTLLIAVVTGALLYYLVRRYFEQNLALLVLALWSCSYLLIGNDQITWNPNFTLLAASLVFWPVAGLVAGKKLKFLDYIFLLLGGFLAYQAHFSGFFLLPLASLALLAKSKKAAWLAILIVALGLLLSLLPTIYFDYRHLWLNSHSLLTFLQDISQADYSRQPYFYHLAKSAMTSLESLAGLLFNNFVVANHVLVILGALLLVLYFLLVKKDLLSRPVSLLPLTWIGLIIIMISFYGGDKPPYYFLIAVPAMLYVLAQLLQRYLSGKQLAQGFVLMLALAVFLSLRTHFSDKTFSLSNQLRLRDYLQQQPVAELLFNLPVADSVGLHYLLDPLTKESEGPIWVIADSSTLLYPSTAFGSIKVWSTSQLQEDGVLFYTETLRVIGRNNLRLYRDNYYQGTARESYLALVQGQVIAQLEAYPLAEFKTFFPQITVVEETGSWRLLSEEQAYFYYPFSRRVFLLSRQSQFTSLENLAAALEIF